MGRVTALSRAVTTVTWMSHGSHEPDADESRREDAGYQSLCLGWKANLVHPLRIGSAYWVPILSRNQMRGPVQRRRAPKRALRPSDHRSGTSCAHISARYAGEVYITLYRVIMSKLVNFNTFPITYFDSSPKKGSAVV